MPEIIRHQQTYRVGLNATAENLVTDTRIENLVQDAVQRGLRPVGSPALDELSDPVGHHTAQRHADGRHADRRPPTGYRSATFGVDCVRAGEYDYDAAAEAHTAALTGETGEQDGTARGYDAEIGESETPTYDATAHDHLEGLIADSSVGEQG
jgi:hypothetical protein